MSLSVRVRDASASALGEPSPCVSSVHAKWESVLAVQYARETSVLANEALSSSIKGECYICQA
jgi:hypothetical protein